MDARAICSETGRDYRDRLVTLSDGIFAIATTLAALDVHFTITGNSLGLTLARSWPSILAYIVSFIITAVFWLSSRDLFSRVQKVDLVLTILTLGVLACIALVPATVRTLIGAGAGTAPFQIYAASVLLCALFNSAAWLWAMFRPGLMSSTLDSGQRNRRLFAALALPALFAPIVLLPAERFSRAFIVIGLLLLLIRSWLLPRLTGPDRRDRKHISG